jgi:ABC-type Zn uptake system ZnuABC Zn-binding protein ZnuA
MQKIASAEVFIVNGAGLEEFLGDPLKRANAKVKVIDASAGIKDFIPMKEEAGHDAHPESGVLRNPHIFAAPSTAAKMVKTIGQELAKVDPDNAGLYAVNAAAYAAILDVTGTAFEVTVAKFRTKKIVTEHAVFDYLARDCGLEIVAVIEEAPGQEPSAAQMLAIIRTIRQSGAAAVFTEPQYSAKVSQTIAAEAKVPVASLDPVASGPAGAALDYYEKTMKSNLETLEKVLGGR